MPKNKKINSPVSREDKHEIVEDDAGDFNSASNEIDINEQPFEFDVIKYQKASDNFKQSFDEKTSDITNFMTITELEKIWSNFDSDILKINKEIIQDRIKNINEKELISQKKKNTKRKE
jgi:hypothetical protein